MKWNVGDKVRLVGSSWSLLDGGRWGRGTQHTVTGVCEGKVRLGEKNYYWHLGRGWEIEPVERKEENMIDISDVNVGDRVKLTRENGDEATFTVTGWHGSRLVSKSNDHNCDSWDTLEIVERSFKLVPGLYTNLNTSGKVVITTEGETYHASQTGSWERVSDRMSHAHDAARGLYGWKREVTF